MLKIGVHGKFNEISYLVDKICKKMETSAHLFQLNNSSNLSNICPKILVFNKFNPKLKTLTFPQDCILLINIDKLKGNINFEENYVITYGFKGSSTITISSINNEKGIQFCIQNNLKSILGNIIYQQEFPVYYQDKSIYSILVATTIGILIDSSPENFKKVF